MDLLGEHSGLRHDRVKTGREGEEKGDVGFRSQLESEIDGVPRVLGEIDRRYHPGIGCPRLSADDEHIAASGFGDPA